MTTQLHVTALGLPGVLLLKSIVHADVRGSFTQSWQAADWRAAGVDIAFMQDNLVCNARRGTLRGMHWQREPHAQAKAVQCVRGALLDVVADVRPESSLFGRWISVELKAGEGESLYASRLCARLRDDGGRYDRALQGRQAMGAGVGGLVSME